MLIIFPVLTPSSFFVPLLSTKTRQHNLHAAKRTEEGNAAVQANRGRAPNKGVDGILFLECLYIYYSIPMRCMLIEQA